MPATRPSTRSSPSRAKSSSLNILQPAQIPLPPSPPASDGLLPPSSPPPHPPQPKRPQAAIRPTATNAPTSRSPPRRRDNPQSLKAVIESKLATRKPTSPRSRPTKRHLSPDQVPLESSSPPTSPTNRQSTRSIKRIKPSCSSPTRSPSSRLRPPHPDTRDSPNNPFLVKPGEKKRLAGAKADDSHRQLVYVFRGKRIPYETTEDLSRTGGSPFGTSGPKLLFPSPPSPAPEPTRKLTFQDSHLSLGPGGLLDPQMNTSPKRDSSHRVQLFQTPKREKSTGGPSSSNRTASHMLPTPQSSKKVKNRPAQLRPTTTHLNGPIKSARTMAKVMR